MSINAKFKYLFVGSVAVLLFLSIFIAVDMHYHDKYLYLAGLNYKGYRGKILGKKQKDEIRIAMVGDCNVWGYGLTFEQAIPFQLEKALQEHTNKKVSVINLAYNSEGAYAFSFNLEDFAFLNYDYVIFLSGYTDMSLCNTLLVRRSNPFFRIFKYYPILPEITKEKIMLLRKARANDQNIVFSLNAKEKLKIAVLEQALNTYNNMEKIVDRLKNIQGLDYDPSQLQQDKWSWYKFFMRKAINIALGKKKEVIVITPPYLNEDNAEQQAALREMLQEFKGNKNFLYINLGESFSLQQEGMLLDGVHFSANLCELLSGDIAKKIEPFLFRSDIPKE